MTTWSGWAADFLAAAKLPHTADNVKFLEDWSKHADSKTCANNPIDLSAKQPHSRGCGRAHAGGRRAQRYPHHDSARSAFVAQLAEQLFAHLRAALESGNPYSVTDYLPVANDVSVWGSPTFANVYRAELAAQAGPVGSAAKTHKGWSSLQHTFNRRMPGAIGTARRSTAAGLRTLGRARKVRL